MVDVSDLEIFEHVVKTHSLTATASQFGLTAASISKRLQKLEARLGARLLNRTTRRVVPTEVGQHFFNRIASANEAIREAEALVSHETHQLRGSLRVSAPTSFGRLHIAPHLRGFMTQYPAIGIEIDLSDEFVDLIGEGFDVAIRIGELPDSGLVARRLAPVHRILCAAPAYLESAGRPRRIEDLGGHVLLAARHQTPLRLHGPDGPVTVHATSALSTNSSEVIREAVLTGLGIALRSTWDVGPEVAAGQLERILPGYSASSRVAIYAVTPSAMFVPEKVKAFIGFLQALYGPKPYWDAQGEP